MYKRVVIAVLLTVVLISAVRFRAAQSAAVSTPGASLAFSTLLGGAQVKSTYGTAIALDKKGGLFVTGRTQAADFPNLNPAQKVHGGGENDAFVTKYATDGQKMLFSTYLGGKDVDMGEDVAVDAVGNVYVAGTTYSKDFPTTKTAVQPMYGGGDRDCFVAKLSPEGALLYSTLLGGTGTDRCEGIAVDSEGNAYVTGSTNSKEWIPTKAEGEMGKNKDWDVFVAKLDPSGSRRIYALRFGGTSGKEPAKGGYGAESGKSIVVDNRGIAYVAGVSDSPDFLSWNAPFPLKGFDGKSIGGFIATVDAAGTSVRHGSIPGYFFESIALDASGGLFGAGTMISFNPNGGPGGTGTFLLRLVADNAGVYRSSTNAGPNKAGTSLYAGDIGISDLALDSQGNAYVIGTTNSTGLQLVNPLQRDFGGGKSALIASDVFVAKIDVARKALLFSTYLGGSGFDSGLGIAVDESGEIFLTGNAGFGGGGSWKDFPTSRALQVQRSANAAFVARISIKP